MKKRSSIFLVVIMFLFSLSFISAFNFETGGVKIIEPLESNGGIPVNIQDQTSDAFLNRFSRINSSPYTLTANTVPDSYFINLTSTTGLIAGDKIGLFQDSTDPQFFFAEIINVIGNDIEVDTPIDNVFNIIDNTPSLFELESDMAIDGDTTRKVFVISNGGEEPIDVTRVLFNMICIDPPLTNSFCDIAGGLDKGIVLRKLKADGTYTNYFNAKINGDLSSLMYDVTYDYEIKNGDVNGVRGRLTFGGQNKIGVVIRLEKNEQLQWIIQDDLTGLVSFDSIAEGHKTQK